MNDHDDRALHELLLAWEEPPPEEAATQRLLNQLHDRLKPTPGRSREPKPNERRRFCWRKRWVWGTVGIILALEGVFAWNRLPPKYQVPRHALPADNGYLDFIAAGDQIKAIEEQLRRRSPYDQGDKPPLTWAEAQALAAKVTPALKRVRQGLGRTYIVAPHETYTADTLFPYLASLRELARQSMLLADVQLVRGDRAGALDTYLLVLELGEQVKHGCMISQLVGIALQSIALSGLVNSPLAADLKLPVQGPSVNDAHRQAWQSEFGPIRLLTEPDWAAAAARLQRLRAYLGSFREALEIEREAGLNMAYEILSSSTPDKEVEGFINNNNELKLYCLLLRAGLINRRREFQEVATAYDWIIAQADHGNWEDRDLEAIVKGNPLSKLLVPVYSQGFKKGHVAHVQLALLELQCWAAAGRRVAPLPDPFSAGQPLRERNGVFYSVGPDGWDDGGEPLESRDFSDPSKRGDLSLLSWFKPARPLTEPSGRGPGPPVAAES